MNPNNKIGAVSYLNALPLISYLDYPTILATPAKLEGMLEQNEIEVALLPVFSFFQNPKLHSMFESGVIQCDGPVESVGIFYPDHLKNVQDIQALHLTPESKTSVNLFRVLEKFAWGKKVSITTDPNQADSFLVIGDDALFWRHPGFKFYDFGAAWKEWTGLPFIFAGWAGTHTRFSELLKEARQQGCRHIPEILQKLSQFPKEKLSHYLTTRIQYEMTPQSQKGLELFREYLEKL